VRRPSRRCSVSARRPSARLCRGWSGDGLVEMEVFKVQWSPGTHGGPEEIYELRLLLESRRRVRLRRSSRAIRGDVWRAFRRQPACT